MHKGTLKKWNDDKGYGFIRRDDGQADVFLHKNTSFRQE